MAGAGAGEGKGAGEVAGGGVIQMTGQSREEWLAGGLCWFG